jgi:DNA-binding winged helix-turn-helix (wHTH) protein
LTSTGANFIAGQRSFPLQPQVFDLLEYLIRNRERVVSKDELINAVWNGRIVSDAALTTRLNAVRAAIGDTGEEQRLIKTLPRKGFRFVGQVRETREVADSNPRDAPESALALPDKPSIAVLPVREHERRSRAGVFCGWDGGRDHYGALAVQIAVRNRSQFELSPLKAEPSISRKSGAGLACAMSLRGLYARRRERCGLQGS